MTISDWFPFRFYNYSCCFFGIHTLKSKKEKETISIEHTGSLTVTSGHSLILSNLGFILTFGQETVSALKTADDSSLIEVSGSLVITSSVLTRIISSTDSLIRIEVSGSHSLSFELKSLIPCSTPAAPLISFALSTGVD